jgi:hypothetical protein
MSLPIAIIAVLAHFEPHFTLPTWRKAAVLFATGTPLSYYLSYFAVLGLTARLPWAVHIWAGTIALAMLTGFFLSYLRVPPALPTPCHPTRSSSGHNKAAMETS